MTTGAGPVSRGVRGIMREEYQANVNRWFKALRLPPPAVVVRQRRGAFYRPKVLTLYVPPSCALPYLIHEAAHHLAFLTTGRALHDAAFRIALVTIAAHALGDPRRYPWSSEYAHVRRWAERHGLLASAPAPLAPRRGGLPSPAGLGSPTTPGEGAGEKGPISD
jgi:hypothetical protein